MRGDAKRETRRAWDGMRGGDTAARAGPPHSKEKHGFRTEPATLTPSEIRQQEKDKHHRIHSYLESNTRHKRTFPQKRNKLMDLEKRLAVAKERARVGWTGGRGLADANCGLWRDQQ